MTDQLQVTTLSLVQETEDGLTLWYWEDLVNLKRSQPFLTEDEAEMAMANGKVLLADIVVFNDSPTPRKDLH